MNNLIKLTVLLIISGALLTGVTVLNKNSDQDSVDLPTIMRLLGSKMDLINEGIYTQNYKLIATGGAGINDHPPLSDETMALLKSTLGNRMQTFKRYDTIVHGTADSLKIAAQNNDMKRILEHYSVIQQGCVNCHAAFQNEIREARLAQSK